MTQSRNNTHPWWRNYDTAPSGKIKYPSPTDTPDPKLAPGVSVELVDRPGIQRKVIKAEWHRHRHRFVYIIETSAINFEPYWFAEQLTPIN